MNASSPTNHDPLHDPLEDTDVDINDKLIAELGLTGESIEKIYEVMRLMGTTFADAAERLGLLRPDAFEQALLKIRSGPPVEDEGMVETAIRRIAADRRVVLRQGERVAPSQQLVLAHDPDNPRSERLRALRTELLLLHETVDGAQVYRIVGRPVPGGHRPDLAIAPMGGGRSIASDIAPTEG